MDGPKDSKSGKERQMPYDMTLMWNLKQDTSELTHETESWTQRTGLQASGRKQSLGWTKKEDSV